MAHQNLTIWEPSSATAEASICRGRHLIKIVVDINVDNCLAASSIGRQEISLSSKLGNLCAKLPIFSTTALYPYLLTTSILSPLHTLNHCHHIGASYYCRFI